MGETLYLNQGLQRKKQIYEWLMDTIENNVFLQNRFNNVQILILGQKIDEATNEFKQMIFAMINSNVNDTLGYILLDNFRTFGQNKVLKDLFIGLFSRTLRQSRISKKRVEAQKLDAIRETTVKELVTELKKEKSRIFGIETRTKKRKLAIIRTVIINKKPQFRLQDKKTGRYLKFTDSFKKQIKQSKGGK